MQDIKNELAQLRRDHGYMLKRIERLERLIEQPDNQTIVNPIVKDSTKVPTAEIESIIPTTDSRINGREQNKDLEFRIGGTWLNRVGVVAVIFGLAYFLKYSIDNAWIGPVGRVILGILAGLVMMGAGEKLRKKYAGYAQGLLGGGSLAIFFSVYASYQFYDLLQPTLALCFLVLIMISTVLMAIRHDSFPIGLLGIVGSYAVPFMIGSNEPSFWMLYTYIALVTCGVLSVSIYKKWMVFQYISFVFNILIFLYTWFASFTFDSDGFWPMYMFLIFNFVMYLGIAGVYNIRYHKKSTSWDVGLNMLNSFFFFGFSLVLLEDTLLRDSTGFYAVLLALVHIYLGRLASRLHVNDKLRAYTFFLISFVLITIAVPIQLSGMHISLAWFAEAVGLVFISRKLNTVKFVYGGLIVWFLGLVGTFIKIGSVSMSREAFLINTPTLLLISAIVSVGAIVRLVRGFKNKNMDRFRINGLLKGLFLFLIFITITFENDHFFELQLTDYFISPEQLSLSALWLIYAIVIFTLGIRRNNKYLRFASLGLLGMVILKAFFIDLADLITVYKILLFIFLGLCLLGISFIYQKKKGSL